MESLWVSRRLCWLSKSKDYLSSMIRDSHASYRYCNLQIQGITKFFLSSFTIIGYAIRYYLETGCWGVHWVHFCVKLIFVTGSTLFVIHSICNRIHSICNRIHSICSTATLRKNPFLSVWTLQLCFAKTCLLQCS